MTWITRLALGVGLTLMCGSAPESAYADSSLMYVTGYAEPGITADGTPVGPDVAACPPDWPFGTVVSVQFEDGPRTVVCHDRYAAFLSPRVDVWWPTASACFTHTGVYPVDVG